MTTGNFFINTYCPGQIHNPKSLNNKQRNKLKNYSRIFSYPHKDSLRRLTNITSFILICYEENNTHAFVLKQINSKVYHRKACFSRQEQGKLGKTAKNKKAPVHQATREKLKDEVVTLRNLKKH